MMRLGQNLSFNRINRMKLDKMSQKIIFLTKIVLFFVNFDKERRFFVNLSFLPLNKAAIQHPKFRA
jgi:hypothetical protein